jgi:uncharacterized protein (TIGR03437 family)
VSKLFLTLAISAVVYAQTTNGVALTPSALTINYQIGAAALPAAQTLQVATTPKGLNFSVAISGAPFNAAWLLVSQSTGVSPATLKVEANPTGLAAGTYAGTITVSATSGVTAYTQAAVVTLVVQSAAASVSVNPTSLSFSYTTGGPVPSPSLASAFIVSSSGSALSATVTVSGATWLKVTPSGNISVIGLLNTAAVTVDPTGLAPKVYTGTIKISAPSATNKTVSMVVTLTVNAAVPVAANTWPPGVIQGSPVTIATVDGSSFFSNSTFASTGFTPAATVTVTDGASTVSRAFLVPVYQTTTTALRLAVGSPLPSGAATVAYSQPLAAAGGTGPYTYAFLSGLLPGGLAIAAGSVSGTPATAGTYLFTILVRDSATPPAQAFSQVELTIDPAGASALRIRVNAAPLPIGAVGALYRPVTLVAAGGTGGPYTWSVSNLPAGMTLSASGVLSGTPSTDGAAGPLTVAIVSDTAALVTLPAADLTTAGLIRMAATTPGPGGGTSNEIAFQVYGPNPQITAVVNSATYLQGTLAPGDVTSIFGVGLGPVALTIFDPSTPPIATSLAGTSVTINGTAAPILYTSATSAGIIVPYTIVGPTAQVIVTNAGLASQAFTVAVAAADPGVFSLASSGQGQGAILNFNASTSDFSINSAANSAAKGSIVVIYMTGAGTTTSGVDNQLIPLSPAITPVLTPTVSIGGLGATVLAAQAPPGSIPGLIQLNVTVPATARAGPAIPLIVTVGGVPSQAGLTMSIK